MSLAERRKSGPPPKEKPCCKLGQWIDALDPAEKSEANAMLADTETWGTSDLLNAFNDEGADISEPTLTRHRHNQRGHVAR